MVSKPALYRVTLAALCLFALAPVGLETGGAHEIITTKITFNKEIVRILAKRCMGCHHEGGSAPMALRTYSETRPWAKAIKEEVLERRMPPWHAVRGYGEFRNDPGLSSRELDLILAWVEGGAPRGDEKDLPMLPDFSGWSLGEPDLVLKPSEAVAVSGEGNDGYRQFVLRNPSAEDRYVTAVDVRGGESVNVRQAFLWIDRSGGSQPLEKSSVGCLGGSVMSESFGDWLPGQRPSRLPEGIARLLPGNSRLTLQVHLENPGSGAVNPEAVGLYFSRTPVKKRLRSFPVANTSFEIPPGNSAYPIRASYELPQDAEAVSVFPHMHQLGRSMEVTVRRPNGSREVLVWVREYDFERQATYVFRNPVLLPRGTRVEVVAYYDNSSAPAQAVRSGDSASDEMCVAYLSYVLRDEDLTRSTSGR